MKCMLRNGRYIFTVPTAEDLKALQGKDWEAHVEKSVIDQSNPKAVLFFMECLGRDKDHLVVVKPPDLPENASEEQWGKHFQDTIDKIIKDYEEKYNVDKTDFSVHANIKSNYEYSLFPIGVEEYNQPPENCISAVPPNVDNDDIVLPFLFYIRENREVWHAAIPVADVNINNEADIMEFYHSVWDYLVSIHQNEEFDMVDMQTHQALRDELNDMDLEL